MRKQTTKEKKHAYTSILSRPVLFLTRNYGDNIKPATLLTSGNLPIKTKLSHPRSLYEIKKKRIFETENPLSFIQRKYIKFSRFFFPLKISGYNTPE